MNFVKTLLPYTGSGRTGLCGALLLLIYIPSIQNDLLKSYPLRIVDMTCRSDPSPLSSFYRLLFFQAVRLLGTLGTVFGACHFSVGHTAGIERSANDVILHTREVFYPSASYQDDGVLL